MSSLFQQWLTKLLFFFLLLTGPLAADTPVEKTVRSMIKEYFMQHEDFEEFPGEMNMDDILDEVVEDFAKKAPKWTKLDAANHKAGKALVEDYQKSLKRWAKFEKHKDFKWFADKAQEKKLSHLEKRALTDLLELLKDEEHREKTREATNNARDIYLVIRKYCLKHGEGLGLAGDNKSSNQLFRKLFVQKLTNDESLFYVNKVTGFRRGDGNIKGKEALKHGENVWTINAGIDVTAAPPNMPLLLCPLMMKDGKIVADPTPFEGVAVILYADGSTRTFEIGEKGEIITPDGPLYSTKHPSWRDEKGRLLLPDFRLPEAIKK